MKVAGGSAMWLSGAMIAFAMSDYNKHNKLHADADAQLKELKSIRNGDKPLILRKLNLPEDPVARIKEIDGRIKTQEELVNAKKKALDVNIVELKEIEKKLQTKINENGRLLTRPLPKKIF